MFARLVEKVGWLKKWRLQSGNCPREARDQFA